MKKITDAIRKTEANIFQFQVMQDSIVYAFQKTSFANWDKDGHLIFQFKSDCSFVNRIHRRINNLIKTVDKGLMTLEIMKELINEHKLRTLNPTRKVLTEKTMRPSDIPISYEELVSEKEQEDLEIAMHELCIILTSDNCHRREEEWTDICSHILTLYECGLHYGHNKTIRAIERFVR